MKINIKKDRKEINKIIKNCLPLMKMNDKICQDCADAILIYFIEKGCDNQANSEKKK